MSPAADRPVARTLRALPTLWRVALSDAVAWRSELLIWLLSTNTPVIMLLLWTAVAAEQPVGRYGSVEFAAYFLATLVVRLLTGAWAVWAINMEIRDGALSMRLLRPLHPFFSYASENLGAWPLRLVMVLPIVGLYLVWLGPAHLVADWRQLALWPVALFLGWAIYFCAMLAIGSLAFWLTRTLNVFEVWLAAFVAFSGYLVPLDLFPERWRAVAEALPFSLIIAFPVELIIGRLDWPTVLARLGAQLAWAALFLGAALWLWSRGIRRYEAVGG